MVIFDFYVVPDEFGTKNELDKGELVSYLGFIKKNTELTMK